MVLDVLRDVPGVDVVQSGSKGTLASVFIRGSDSDQVLVLIDGVEVNSTLTGSYDFAHLTTESIERIEVLRGAGGTLYGSQAIGGVIHIITKAGGGAPKLQVSAEGGNADMNRQALSVRGKSGPLRYFLSASHLDTNGFRSFNDDYKNIAVVNRLDLHAMDNASLTGIFHFRKTDVGLFNSNNFIPIADPNAREAVTDYIAQLNWNHQLRDGWDYRLATSFYKQNDTFSDDPEPGSFDVATRNHFHPQIISGEFQTNYRWAELSTTTFGTEYRALSAKTDQFNESQWNFSFYLQEQLKLLKEQLFLVGGVRFDNYEAFGTAWTPSASASYLIRETDTKIKASYTQGFKAPSLNELFFPGFGNPDLSPEKSWEVNFGVEQRVLGQALVGVTYFHRKVDDLIQFVPPTFQARNVAEATIDGIEVIADVGVWHGLSLRSNYTFLTSRTSTGPLLRRPRHRGNVAMNYRLENLNINVSVNVVGKRDDVDPVTRQTVVQPGYVTVDMATTYRLPWQFFLFEGLSVYGKIENLFDKKYEQAAGFLAPPLNFFFGVRGTLAMQ